MLTVGSVFWKDYVVFKNHNGVRMNYVDHARRRPFLVVAMNDEYMYCVALTSNNGKTSRPTTYCDERRNPKNVSLSQIFKERIYGRKEIHFIERHEMVYILTELIMENEIYCEDDVYKEIKDDLYKFIKDNDHVKKFK